MHWNKLLTLLAIGLIPITSLNQQVVQSSTEGKTEFVPQLVHASTSRCSTHTW